MKNVFSSKYILSWLRGTDDSVFQKRLFTSFIFQRLSRLTGFAEGTYFIIYRIQSFMQDLICLLFIIYLKCRLYKRNWLKFISFKYSLIYPSLKMYSVLHSEILCLSSLVCWQWSINSLPRVALKTSDN